MSSVNSRFGGKVRAARDSANMTQEQLAEAVGVSRTAITNLESGKQGTTIEMLFKLAVALKREPVSLLPKESGVDSEILGKNASAIEQLLSHQGGNGNELPN